jgi:hypothetical protein
MSSLRVHETTYLSHLFSGQYSTFVLIGTTKTDPSLPNRLVLVALSALTSSDRQLSKVHEWVSREHNLVLLLAIGWFANRYRR